jgi:hypothetical protein
MPAMGMFEVKVKLASLTAPGRTEEISLLVDTGATLSRMPREVLMGFMVERVAKKLIPRDLLAL